MLFEVCKLSKIGYDVDVANVPSFDKSFTSSYITNQLKPKVLDILRKSEVPLNISQITNILMDAPMGHGKSYGSKWVAVKKALISLELEGKLKHFYSGMSMNFVIQQLPVTASEEV